MEERIKDILRNVFIENIEKLAFMFAEEVGAEEFFADTDDFVEASITFKGESSGVMKLMVPRDMLTEIAGNVLGMDENDDLVLDRGGDALKEVLNVVCGHFLTEYAGDKAVFDLTPPELKSIDKDTFMDESENSDYLKFTIDESPALLTVQVK